MAQTQVLSPIDATVEKETVTFDFGTPVTSIVSFTCQVSAVSLVQDAAASSRLIGSAAIVNAPPLPNGSGVALGAVAQRVGTMLGGVTYLLQCVAIVANGDQLSLWAHLPCQTPT